MNAMSTPQSAPIHPPSRLLRRLGWILLWVLFCILAGWIFYPRYNVPEPAPRLSTQAEPAPAHP